MLQKEKTYIKSRGWKRFEFKDQGKFNFLSSGKHITVSSVASEGQY